MNWQLPKTARVNKFIAKTRFYDRVTLGVKLQNEFIHKIQKITWLYKLAEETINISKTDNVTEIQIFVIELKEQVIPKNVLKVIDKTIPYPILYQFVYENNRAYGMALKEKNNIKTYYFSEWDEEVRFDFTGINLEKVYQKLIQAFIPNKAGKENNFNDVVALDRQIKTVQKEMFALENKIRKEKQFNRKVEINKILLEKNKELERLTSNITK